MKKYQTIIENLSNIKNNKIELNEENTKMALILPFLQEQGFNIFDLNELQSEYVSDMRNNGGEKVDYALMINNKPIVFLEAKPLGTLLDKYIGQLQRYYTADKEVKYGVLTDGQYYWFFSDDERANIMDDKPFYELDLLCLKDIDIEFLKLFTKESLKDVNNIEKHRYRLKLRYFIENSIKNPDDDFINYISNRTGLKTDKGVIIDELSSLGVSYLSKSDKIMNNQNIFGKKNKILSRKPANKPISYVLNKIESSFTSWRELVFIILNLVIQEMSDLESVKQNVSNTGNWGILKTSDHRYNYKQLNNGEYVYLQLSADDSRRLIDKILKSSLKYNIEYKY